MKKPYNAGSVKSRLPLFLLFVLLLLGNFYKVFSQAPVATTSYALRTTETNIDPRGAAITPDGSKAIIAEWERARVRIIDLSNNTHVFAAAQFAPNDVTVNSQGTYAYVTNLNSNSISRINLTDNTSIPDFVTGIASVGNVREIEITPDGNTAIVSTNQQWSDASNFVVFIDLVNRTVLSRLAIPGGANILTMNATGTTLYTSGIAGAGNVTKIDIASRTVVTSWSTATSNVVKGLVLSGDGNTLYTLHTNGYVSAYGSLNSTPSQLWSDFLAVASLNTDYFTNSCVIDTNTSRMYVVTHNTTGASNQLITIDLVNRTKLYTTGANTWPNSIGISGNGKKLMVSLRRFNDARLYTVPSFLGAGTVGDPYRVTSWSQLNSMRDNLSAHYKLMNNLDASSSGYSTYAASSSNSSSGWMPIGNSATPFTGSFDGNGFSISGLNINRTSSDDVGLFGQLGAASLVKNLKVQSASVAGGNKVGILAGSTLGTIRDCSFNGSVTGTSKIGGIAGESSSTIERCMVSGTVTASSSYAGGVFGIMNAGSVTDAYSLASVNGSNYTGGFGGSISGSFLRSYSAGSVSGSSNTGGFAGISTASISKVYWDAEGSGQLTSAAGISKTTSEIKNYSLFFTDGWDLQCERANGNTDTWGLSLSVNNGYPFLSLESGTTTCPQWNSQSNNSFNENSNWESGFKPAKGMDLVISSQATQNLVLPENWEIGNLSFNGSGAKIVLNDYHLVVLGSITNANAQNYIQTNGAGRVKKVLANSSTFSFPVGNSAYNPVTITNNTGASDSLFVRVRDEVLMKGNSGVSVTGQFVNRTWDIDKHNPNNGSGLNFIFNWNSGEENSPMANPALFHFESNAWVRQTGSTSYTSNNLTYNGYTGSFSPFAIADAASLLAIDSKSVSVSCDNGVGVIQWSVTTNNPDLSFYVEKSSDLQNWKLVKVVSDQNNKNFIVRDQSADGSAYYRVRQKDTNGKESISSVSKLNCGVPTTIRVTPVPASNNITLKGITGQGKYVVIGLHGQALLSGIISSSNPVINISSLKNGVYYLQISAGENITSQKIIVQK